MDARSFEAEARVRRQRGEHVRRSSDTPTLRDFAADWMDRRGAAGLSEATLKTNNLIFEKHFDPYLGGLRVGDLSPRRLDEWLLTRGYLSKESIALVLEDQGDADGSEVAALER